MKPLQRTLLATLALLACTSVGLAGGRKPGSVLVYPIHRTGQNFFTVVSVTNENTIPETQVSLGGSTTAMFEYVNMIPNPALPALPLDCYVVDRSEILTPADTFSILTTCHNAAGGNEGYLVVTATDPSKYKTPWSWNHLMGSELVVTSQGGTYGINAIPFDALLPERQETDVDDDGMRDFDGVEYEGIPELLYIDSFVAVTGSSLTLINMTGGTKFSAVARFDVWNDDEFQLSATKLFRCWFEEPLEDVSLVFRDSFLRSNTPHDPQELDLDCDGAGDYETGWARIQGLTADSSGDSIPNPAFLGAITAGPVGANIDGGRLLWESRETQDNGSFLNFSIIAPRQP